MWLSGTALGVVMMLIVQVIMPVNDALAKYLSGLLPALQIAWARFFFNAFFILPWAWWRTRGTGIAVQDPGLQVVRGIVIVVANICFVSGVRYVPLADALAIVFIAPLAVTALSARFLGERVSFAHWMAVIVGFVGALVIIRPGFSGFHPAALLPLSAGLLFSVYLVLTRRLVRTSSPDATQAVTTIVGASLLSLVVPFVWEPLPFDLLLLMIAIGMLSGVGHILMTSAHVHAEASTLAPLTYIALIVATFLGYLLFDDLPDGWTIIGAAIVIGSGLFIWWHGSVRRVDDATNENDMEGKRRKPYC
ncbi:MAG: DMT family transporter [Geminicoccaceae bacterium]